MIVSLPPDLIAKFEKALSRAGPREIGGVLVGEHVADAEFRIVDISVQHSGGTVSCFVRKPEKHKGFIKRFFRRTGADYTRFNYLGEWHSHPLYLPVPSAVDFAQMQQIVEDGPNAPLFAVLLIVRLGEHKRIDFGAMAFTKGSAPTPVQIRVSERPDCDPTLPNRLIAWRWKRPGWWPSSDVNRSEA
ncbi:Mov34/MPN/PAD-1 family protein [Sphingobium sp. DC-2]|jgi:integrative and conjugative element protein (TIGR02256 family)|uniref:Mov34/MPN/PAD-1 family protein n=1 Tax=Sphingobium sp. DC-2 TaxID=1303256 RepID=UPI0009DC9C5E|nr:Mov34/MPN/PAD-1 family protein [Sphingobium sp. DC-2]